MSPPDSERSRSLPTLTWESIVDREPIADRDRVAAPAPGAAPTPRPPAPSAPPGGRADSPPPPPPDAALGGGAPGDAGPVSLSLHLGDVMPVPPPPPLRPASLPPATEQPVDEFHLSFGSLALAAGDVGEIEVGENAVDENEVDENEVDGTVGVHDGAETSLPMIREATPVEPYISDAPVEAVPSTVETTTVATVDSVATPLIPGSNPGPIVLPPATQPDQSSTRPAVAVSPLAVEIPQRGPAKKRRGRSGLKLVVMLVLLGGIVAAGIVYGRPYLFPDDWAENAGPYASAVESVTGAEFSEPLTVNAEATAAFQTRSTAQLAGDFAQHVPMWRALGLATGDVTEASLTELLGGWESAMYSTADGQIYHDDSLTTPNLEAELTMAMATAWLDQEFGWAIGQADRTLDGAAMTSAEVRAQSAAILAQSEYDTDLAVPPTGPLLYLPAVISYQTLAPAMYAPLLAPVSADAANPLGAPDASASSRAGGLAADDLELAGAATLTGADVIVGSPATMDRSFWYLVFAGFLDAPTAYGASESIVESALTITQRAGTTCASSTFSGGDLIQTETLREAMETWVGLAPAEMTSTFSVGADGSLQMQSCDPGAQAAPNIRLGVARELVGWRSAELATVSGVLAAGGGDAEIAEALDRLAASNVGAQLATSPVDNSPADAAAAARAAVEPIVTPPPPPSVEPTTD